MMMMMMTQLGLFLYRIFRASKKNPLAFSLLLQAKTRFTTSSGDSTIEPCWSWTASDWDPVATIQPAETRKFNGISVWNPKNSCFSGAGVDCLKTRPNRWVARRVECLTVAEEQRLHSCCQRSLCSKPFSFDKMRVWPFWTATRSLRSLQRHPARHCCATDLIDWEEKIQPEQRIRTKLQWYTMIKDARNNGREKWAHRPPWCDWQRAFRLQYLLLNKRVLMQFIKSQHEEDTFGAHSEGMPHMPQFWRSTTETYCIWFHRSLHVHRWPQGGASL